MSTRRSQRSSRARPPDALARLARVGWEDQQLALSTRSARDRPRGPSVLFSHDTERALACIVDLVNSAPSSGPAGGSGEQLPDLDALRAFVVLHDISEVGDLTPDDVRGVRALREVIAAVFDATDDRS